MNRAAGWANEGSAAVRLLRSVVPLLALMLVVQAPLHRLHAVGVMWTQGAHTHAHHSGHAAPSKAQPGGGGQDQRAVVDCTCCSPPALDLPPAQGAPHALRDVTVHAAVMVRAARPVVVRATARGPPGRYGSA